MAGHIFSKQDLLDILNEVVGLTLGEVDKNNVFDKTKNNPKITGIAGDVVEQSILGYPPDSKQDADLLVDGVAVELKTTGIKAAKKGNYNFEAKEPISITAVSPYKIKDEQFYDSMLWHKLEFMLLVYYLYDSDTTVKASEYSNFTIQGFQFHEFSKEDRDIIRNDWEIVRDFIKDVIDNNKDIDIEFPKISKLRDKMLYMDTAPKYPNYPRFRLKRKVVSTIVQEHFGKDFELLKGNNKFTSYKQLDEILHTFTKKYKNRSIKEIAEILGIELKRNKEGKVNKSITENILTVAFGVKKGKLRDIDTFAKIGTIPKSLTLTTKGARTEDIKFDTIDFEEWTDENIEFEYSVIYDFFLNQTFIFSIFEEAYANSPLEENIFKGFKRLNFDEEFIDKEVKKTWQKVRELINNKTFKVCPVYDKDNNLVINKTGEVKEENNFPKSKDHKIFLRGTSSDSTNKPLNINGYNLYPNNSGLKGLR